jgi:hypothetical protein
VSSRVGVSFSQATRDDINADVPLGAWAAAAEASSKAPTFSEIRKGSFAEYGRKTSKDNSRNLPCSAETSTRESNGAHKAKRLKKGYEWERGITL